MKALIKEEFFSVKEAAELLDFKRSYARRLLNKELKQDQKIRYGKKLYFHKPAVFEFFEDFKKRYNEHI